MLQTPVALILFNRPDTTAKVLAEIAAAKPKVLFVIADGPRADRPDDSAKCAAARAVIERVDWPCEVVKNFSDTNLGCGRRPATGIGWVFEQVDRAIILEDDCVPHPTFFRFCDELLENYRDDERIMQIGGNNFQFGRRRGESSYFFSRHNLCAGGWATWRRAWAHFDPALKLWPQLKTTAWLNDVLDNPLAVRYWSRMFDRAHQARGAVDFWDYQWTFAVWAQSGLSALPNRTLVTNIGFRPDGTHTKSGNNRTANLPTEAMRFPLQRPPAVIRDREADRYILEEVVLPSVYRPNSLVQRLVAKTVARLPVPVRNQLSRLRAALR